MCKTFARGGKIPPFPGNPVEQTFLFVENRAIVMEVILKKKDASG